MLHNILIVFFAVRMYSQHNFVIQNWNERDDLQLKSGQNHTEPSQGWYVSLLCMLYFSFT